MEAKMDWIITADGAITISNLMANSNDGIGAYLINNGTSTITGTITLTGTNYIADNHADGLDAAAHGSITLNNVTADNNGGRGVYGNSAAGSILVACGSMTNNGWYGWSFQSLLTVTLHGVFAYGNNAGLGNTNPASGTFIYQRTCP